MNNNYIEIFKTITNMSESLTIADQLVTTKELFYREYDGVNPIGDDAKIPEIREQLDIVIKSLTYETFRTIRNNKPSINLVEYSYFGYSRDVLSELLMNIILTKDMQQHVRQSHISKFSMIADELTYSLAKSLIYMLILSLVYQADELVAAIAYYFYVNCGLSTTK